MNHLRLHLRSTTSAFAPARPPICSVTSDGTRTATRIPFATRTPCQTCSRRAASVGPAPYQCVGPHPHPAPVNSKAKTLERSTIKQNACTIKLSVCLLAIGGALRPRSIGVDLYPWSSGLRIARCSALFACL